MSKALEALEKLNHTICFNINEKTLKFSLDKYDNCDCKDINDFANCYKTIEKELKALKIIKEKKVDVEQIIENPDWDNVIWYNTSFTGVLCESWRMLTQEEYDLVRKALL